MAARVVVNVITATPFCILSANASSYITKLAKDHRVSIICLPRFEGFCSKHDEHYSYLASHLLLDSVNDMNNNPASNCPQNIREHETIQQDHNDCLNKDWRRKVKMADRYEKLRSKFFHMLEKIEDMSDGQLGRITTLKNQFELASEIVRPVQNESFQSWPSARKFTANVIDWTLKDDIIEPATTDWLSQVICAQKKRFALILCWLPKFD